MRWFALLLFLPLFSCGVQSEAVPPPSTSFLTANDGKRLPLQHWNLKAKPKTVVIALHGVEGASQDFQNLGKTLSQKSPDTSLYALNLRGSGYDPDPHNKGNISSPSLWMEDLETLHKQLRKRHPKARFIWMGESMGSQIVLHTAAQAETLPDGLILVSPVVSLDFIPPLLVTLLKTAAILLPDLGISMKTLAGGQLPNTPHGDPLEQGQKNPYHVPRYRLRYLNAVATLSESMKEQATAIQLPTLILNGEKDPLTKPEEVIEFAKAFAAPPKQLSFAESQHLLFYDQEKEEVIAAIHDWLRQTTKL